jgi:hypothetical protein
MTQVTSDGGIDSPRPPADMPFSASMARMDVADEAWPLRPWILALICAVAGWFFYWLVEVDGQSAYRASASGGAAFVGVASVCFALGVERRRWMWAALFSVIWGVVIGLVLWRAAHIRLGGDFFLWPFFSGLLAVLIATPFFQARRDVAADGRHWRLWQLPYQRLHDHAWTDAVIGAAGVIFAGLSLLLMLMIGGMFNLIGIKFISNLMEEGWFILPLAGAGFGGAVGLLRERDRMVASMQRLVMVVLSVLAPVLAVAAALFLLSLLGTGLAPLWQSGFSSAAMLLLSAAVAVLLANAVFGNVSEEQSRNGALRYGAMLLCVVVLPLTGLAAVAVGLRVTQYGWTPERLWGAIAVGVALAYGVAGVWAVVRGRGDFAEWLRPLQQKLAAGVMVLATILALPIVDFGAISARSQLARLQSGAISTEKFDWRAMAFDFGPKGREALKSLTASSNKEWAASAAAALKADKRWQAERTTRAVMLEPLEKRMRLLPEGAAYPAGLLQYLKKNQTCEANYSCAVYVLDPSHVVLLSQYEKGNPVQQQLLLRTKDGAWRYPMMTDRKRAEPKEIDLRADEVRMETVDRKRLWVGGAAQGDLTELD